MWREEVIKATPEIAEKMTKEITAMNVVRVLKVVTSAEVRWSSWMAARVAMVNGRKKKESVRKWKETEAVHGDAGGGTGTHLLLFCLGKMKCEMK
ncbi:hypothetical protein CTI12_AA542140 [Artemisia annua]|uniref:Uncharacterized protein n=1 Tax=Artemisia annua TaxID=35608 RepID=A0A2U1L151_ARTAN|nr:hypothetical protein CTI12_AA542140 [Artemisia annua]